jgi:hypothetical protein
MKTNLLHKSFFIICALMLASFNLARAQVIDSTWIGQSGDNWNDASKWNPAIVPNNSGSQTFNVSIGTGADFTGINLDIDVTVSSLALTTDDFPTVFSTDHNLTSAATSVAVNFPNEQFGGGVLYFEAQHRNVLANLGALADFSGTTLNGGNYLIVSDHADPGMTSTIQFNGADIRTSDADMQLGGPGARIVDENGNDALRNFQHNLVTGIFDFETGRNFTSAGSIVNEGEVHVISEFAGADANTTLTVNGDYTGIGFPLDPGTNGISVVLAAGPIGEARMVINGALTNYDARSKTLHKTYYFWGAANGRSATTQVFGGSKPLDIVTSEAALILSGPNTGFRDRNGNDALRNLATSARMLIGDRDFSTRGSFTTTSRLSVFGDAQFTVNGNLTVQSGFFEVSPLTSYARDGEDGFPQDPPYVSTNATIRANFNELAGSILRFHIFNTATPATVTIGGNANFAGSLEASVEDPSQISSSDSFRVLTAKKITGQFSNVVNGGRVTVYSGATSTGQNVGDPVGTFLVTITKTSIFLSDFQPSAP